MYTETDYIKILAAKIAATIRQNEFTDTPDEHLQAEVIRLHHALRKQLLSLDNFTQRESFYFNTLMSLVDACDLLYGPVKKITANVKLVMDLLAEIKKVLPAEIHPDLVLSRAFVHLKKENVESLCKNHERTLTNQQIDPELITIVTIPFRQFANPKHRLYWRNYIWLKEFEYKLDNIDWDNADCGSKTEAVMSLLINCDFNHDQFFIYCKRYIMERTGKYGTKRKRLAEFAECKKLILQDTLDEFPPYRHRRPNISKKLVDWIGIETEAIIANDSFDDEQFKIEFNLDSTSLAILFKHLMEHGITKTINVDLYAKQIAATCSSKGKEELKWETIKAKFYIRIPRYLKRIYDPFISIIDDIKRFLK